MPRVLFLPSRQSIEVKQGTLLITAAQRLGLPVGQSCGRLLLCGDCRMTIVSGLENLSPPEEREYKLRGIEQFEADERASCRAEVLGDVTARASYW